MMRKLALLFLLFAFFLLTGQAGAGKKFVSGDLETDAVRLEQNIGKDWGPPSGRLPSQLSKGEAALNRQAAIVAANPKDSGAWLFFSRLAIDAAGDDETLKENATAAAYLAYKKASAKADKAAALAWLGQLYVRRSMWRPALDAYRASLDLADNAQVRNIYEDLREKHGFRVLNYRVDNESASPRACFQFSEPLAQVTGNYAPYVTASGFS
jgi:alpha-2-macroglobulin